MTGKELIMYILANDLEDEPVFKDGTFIGFDSEDIFAARMNVGVATVRAWVDTGMIGYSIRIGDKYYIPTIYSERFKK